ncbi:monovalent cation/H+ antiporter subunit D family protein [soil metagenome]
MPVVVVLIPFLATGAVLASWRRPNLREAWTLLAAVGSVAANASMLPRVLEGQTPEAHLFELVPGVDLALRADAAGMLFALSASVLWLLASVYSIGYVRSTKEHHQTRYFASFAICVAATLALAFSANLFTFFIFYERLTLATPPFGVHGRSPVAVAAGRRYLRYLLGGGTALLLAVGTVQALAPGNDFTAGGYLDGTMSRAGLIAVAVLAVLGFGTKAAVMPFHKWLPSAMVAPTPVSALLHTVAVVKAGVFGFVRVFGFVIGPETLADIGMAALVATLAAITIVVASVIALRQDNLKRRLAYSTIAHLSYIVLGVSLLAPDAWYGGLLHIANHALLKITLFFCVGAIYVATGVDKVSDMNGIGRRMPLTMAAWGIASLGLAGVPPVGGFVSKWFLGLGAIDAGQPVLAAVVLGSGLLTAGYLLPVFPRAFFRPSERFTTYGEAPLAMVVPLLLTALLALSLGIGDFFSVGKLAASVSEAVKGVAP